MENDSTDNVIKILISLRHSLTAQDHQKPARTLKKTHVPSLDVLITQNFRETASPHISVTGRAIHFVYALTSHVAGPLGQTLLIIDLEGRFDATRLTCGEADLLRHIYVHRPARSCSPEMLREVVAEARKWMLYGKHGSTGREWWGTVVIGGSGGDVSCGWKGWLRVDRAVMDGFPVGASVEEALALRTRRQDMVDQTGWVVSSEYGSFVFRDKLLDEENHQEPEDTEAKDSDGDESEGQKPQGKGL